MTAGDWRQSPNGNGTPAPGPVPNGRSATAQPVGPTPGPVPMAFRIGQATTVDGKTWAVLICSSAEGVRQMFMDPATAAVVGRALTEIAAAGNIHLPPPGLILGE